MILRASDRKDRVNLSLKMFLVIMMAACVLGIWQNWGGFAQVKLDLLEFGQNNLSCYIREILNLS